eukprot:8467596-Lingulodinium_polyedra.AAC.1
MGQRHVDQEVVVAVVPASRGGWHEQLAAQMSRPSRLLQHLRLHIPVAGDNPRPLDGPQHQ